MDLHCFAKVGVVVNSKIRVLSGMANNVDPDQTAPSEAV